MFVKFNKSRAVVPRVVAHGKDVCLLACAAHNPPHPPTHPLSPTTPNTHTLFTITRLQAEKSRMASEADSSGGASSSAGGSASRVCALGASSSGTSSLEARAAGEPPRHACLHFTRLTPLQQRARAPRLPLWRRRGVVSAQLAAATRVCRAACLSLAALH